MLLIGELYNEEEQLKGYDPDSRLAKRQELVKPYLDAFYKFIEEIDVSSSILSGKLKDAIAYALNQKALLSRFLEDGYIPIDNGSAERAIRGIAIGRRNWLFCNTVTGAETSAILYSIVETASANGADIYTYLRYLLETMPRHLDDHDKSFLEDMLPWSATYKQYEAEKRLELCEFGTPVSEERPKHHVRQLHNLKKLHETVYQNYQK